MMEFSVFLIKKWSFFRVPFLGNFAWNEKRDRSVFTSADCIFEHLYFGFPKRRFQKKYGETCVNEYSWRELNPRLSVDETDALPLSYRSGGVNKHLMARGSWVGVGIWRKVSSLTRYKSYIYKQKQIWKAQNWEEFAYLSNGIFHLFLLASDGSLLSTDLGQFLEQLLQPFAWRLQCFWAVDFYTQSVIEQPTVLRLARNHPTWLQRRIHDLSFAKV